jgi:hypothetical protein
MHSWDSPFGASSGNLARRREMARQVSKQSIEEMRAVLGPEPSDMDLIRALHLSRNDVASAINILFDTPHFQSKSAKSTARAAPSIKAKGTPATKVHTEGNKSSPTLPNIVTPSHPQPAKVLASLYHAEAEVIHSLSSPTMANTVTQEGLTEVLHVSHQPQSNQFQYPILSGSLFDENSNLDLCPRDEDTLDFPGKSPENRNLTRNAMEICEPLSSSQLETRPPTLQLESQALFTGFPEPAPVDNGPLWPENFPASKLDQRATHRASVALLDKEWVLLGETEIVAFSTCKGPKLQPGDPLEFSFPKQSVGSGKGPFEVRKPWGRSKGTAEIVRFSCGEWGEVGRIPGDWARSLIPLIQTGKVRVDGKCQCAPATLSLLDSIVVLLQ